jgi:hypothetical protein
MMGMSLLQLQHDDLRGRAGDGRSMLVHGLARFCFACALMHRAIVKAKPRRLQNEVALEDNGRDELSRMNDATRYRQRPLILGDKWDF